MDLIRRVGGQMESRRGFGPRGALLPYEVDICKSIGITAEEYLEFFEAAYQYVAKRQKEYDLVPDIRNNPTTVAIVQLVIGLALTAVSALLAPKPKTVRRQQAANLDIPSEQGRTRYTKQSNFDAVQQLASLGRTIPLIFTERVDRNNNTFGGVRVETDLIFSQLLTTGSSQIFSGIFNLCLGRLAEKPDYDGIAIGDLLLRDLPKYKQQLYFSNKNNNNRITADDQYSRTKLELSSDTSDETDRFDVLVPTGGFGRSARPWFSGTRTPSTSTQFGAYSPISNSHIFYVPYELTIVQAGTGEDNKNANRAKRDKVRTEFPRYSSITRIRLKNNQYITTYQITPGNINRFDYEDHGFRDWGISDVQSLVNENRARTDELIQLTEQYLIGNALSTCVTRPFNGWYEELTQPLIYEFKTLDGVRPNLSTDNCGGTGLKGCKTNQPFKDGVIMRAAIASITNSRPCKITEIGIRSEVWRQVTNLANYQAHPSYETITKFERKQEDGGGGQITLGTVTKYTKRWSFFNLQAKPLSQNDSDSWVTLNGNTPFAVKGNSPVNQYNTIAISCTESETMNEFRLVPVPGSTFYDAANTTGAFTVYHLNGQDFWSTNSNRTQFTVDQYTVNYTGTRRTLNIADFTNYEWIFGDDTTPAKLGGEITALSSYSYPVDGAIPSRIIYKPKGDEYNRDSTNKYMVQVTGGEEIECYNFIWNNKTKVNCAKKQTVFVEENGKTIRYKMGNIVRPFIPEQFVPSPPGSKIEYKIDIVSYPDGVPGFIPISGVVKNSDGEYDYYWEGKLRVTAQDKNWFKSESSTVRYRTQEFVDECESERKYFEDGPLLQNLYEKDFLNTVTTGAIKISDGTYDVYYKGEKACNIGNENFKSTTIPAKGRWYLDSLKQAERIGEYQYSGAYRQVVNIDGLEPELQVPDGVFKDRKTNQWVYRFGGEERGRATGSGEGYVYNGDFRFNRDLVTDPVKAGGEGNQIDVWRIEKADKLPDIYEIFSISFKYEVIKPEICPIRRFEVQRSIPGEFRIIKDEQSNETMLPRESVADLVPKDRTFEDGDLATVRLYEYPSFDDPSVIEYATWTLERRGDNYLANDCVEIVGLNVQGALVSPIVTGIKIPEIPDSGNGFENFIKPGRNVFPLNAISDYFINENERSSHQDNPEHEVVFVNEILDYPANEEPQYSDLALLGLKITNSKEWSNLSNLSAYISKGLEVERLFERDGIAAGSKGPTNLFPEIAYALLTDPLLGAGTLIGVESVDRDAMALAAQFCEANRFYWDGVISQEQNLREFIFEQAAFCMLDFTIKGGRFALLPSVTYGNKFKINPAVLPTIKALFTDGNMKSMQVSFLEPEQRQAFQASVLYRSETKNGFSQTRTKIIRLSADDPIEQFDMTQFCTNEDHAVAFGKYALATRTLVTHGIKFQTTPNSVAGLEPGDYMRVATTVNHVSTARSGSIDPSGFIQTASTLGTGNINVVYWTTNTTTVQEASLRVEFRTGFTQPVTTQTRLFNSLWCEQVQSTQERIYKVESISFADDGLIEVAGSEIPLTASGQLATLEWVDNEIYEVVG